jgi:hypothetical protein
MADETTEHGEEAVHKNGPFRDERDQRGRFRPGHGGRKPGSRNRASVIAEQLIAGESERLVRKAIDLALEGNVPMLIALLRTLVPPGKAQPSSLRFQLPLLKSAQDAVGAMTAIAASCADGLDAEQVRVLINVVDTFARTLSIADLETRLAVLDAKMNRAA